MINGLTEIHMHFCVFTMARKWTFPIDEFLLLHLYIILHLFNLNINRGLLPLLIWTVTEFLWFIFEKLASENWSSVNSHLSHVWSQIDSQTLLIIAIFDAATVKKLQFVRISRNLIIFETTSSKIYYLKINQLFKPIDTH